MSHTNVRTIAATIVLAGACSGGATKGPATPSSAPAIKLYALDCGHIHLKDADKFADDGSLKGKTVDAMDPCYLIRHPKGDLMWDFGLDENMTDAKGMDIPDTPYHFSIHKKLTAQLAELSVPPSEIELVSISHAHGDHTGNLDLFAGSTLIVDKDEIEDLFYEDAHKPLAAAKRVVIETEADYDVFGDGTVKIIQAPGHTPGHTMLLVQLRSGPVVLTGDLFPLEESRAGRLVPKHNTDRAQTLSSMDKLEALVKATGARVVRQHVTADFTALPAFPSALE